MVQTNNQFKFMEAVAHWERKNREDIFREKIEGFNSSGKLYPYLQLYYTEGVHYVMSFLNDGKLFLEMVIKVSELFREDIFITVRLCNESYGVNRLEFRKRNGEVLKKEWMPGTIPVECGFCLCFYLIGRTLILPVEY